MSTTNKYLLIFLFTSLSFPQEYLQNQFEYAESLVNAENYFDAVTEFKRLQFFDKENIYSLQANEFIARCYKEGGKYNESIKYLILAEMEAEKPADLFRIKTEIIRTNILRRTTSNALKLLDELSKDKRWLSKADEINYWLGWAYIFADEWDKAAEEFSKISPDHELKKLSQETHNKKYSVTFAKLASVVLPGAGQFYTEEYLSGLISLAWCGLWSYIAVDAFIEDRIFDGLTVTNLLWFRFYRGNLQNAERFAIEKNINIVNESLDYLLYNYKGIKP